MRATSSFVACLSGGLPQDAGCRTYGSIPFNEAGGLVVTAFSELPSDFISPVGS